MFFITITYKPTNSSSYIQWVMVTAAVTVPVTVTAPVTVPFLVLILE